MDAARMLVVIVIPVTVSVIVGVVLGWIWRGSPKPKEVPVPPVNASTPRVNVKDECELTIPKEDLRWASLYAPDSVTIKIARFDRVKIRQATPAKGEWQELTK